MKLRLRAQQRLWGLRLGQALVAAVGGGAALGLSGAVEGLAPKPLVTLGALLAAAVVLVCGRPWMEPELAIDPAQDSDGLLRTALCAPLSAQQKGPLMLRARQRKMHFRPLPQWQGVALLLALSMAASAWILLAPVPLAPPRSLDLTSLQGLGLDGRPSPKTPSAAVDFSAAPRLDFPISEAEDGIESPEDGQWPRVSDTDDTSALRFGVDLGLEQSVYDRYLRNRAKQ